jgi:hypothetical protein
MRNITAIKYTMATLAVMLLGLLVLDTWLIANFFYQNTLSSDSGLADFASMLYVVLLIMPAVSVTAAVAALWFYLRDRLKALKAPESQ